MDRATGVPAGLLFLLLVAAEPFSAHENGSGEGDDELLLANMGILALPCKLSV